MGFRSPWAQDVAAAPGAVDWFEIIADGYLGAGGARRTMLERLRADHRLVVHGLSLSIAGDQPLPSPYLRGLRALVEWLEPEHVSDHLCWTAFGGHESHDLLPLAYTTEVLEHVATRIDQVQSFLGRRLVLENPTVYVAFRDADMSEAEFFAALHQRTGCGMLLDVNNLYVNAANLGVDPPTYLATIPPAMVVYMHLAGHAVLPDVRIDTHDAAVPDPVWALYDAAVARFPGAGLIVERDDDLPAYSRLVEEVTVARARHDAVVGAPSSASAATCWPGPPTKPRAGVGWPTLQCDFFSRLVDKPIGYDHRQEPGLEGMLRADLPVAAARGLRVYSDAYDASLARALTTNFPTLARILSSRDFVGLRRAYLRAHPSRTYDFRRLGSALPRFIVGHAFTNDYGVPAAVLSEVSALEQAQLEVSAAPDERIALPAAALAGVPEERWANVQVTFVAPLRAIPCTHAVAPAVAAVARGESPARPAPGPVVYLVGWAAARLVTLALSVEEAVVYQRLRAGYAFGAAVQDATTEAASLEAAVVMAMKLLATLCSHGFVVELVMPDIDRGDAVHSTGSKTRISSPASHSSVLFGSDAVDSPCAALRQVKPAP